MTPPRNFAEMIRDFDAFRDDIAFVRAFKKAEFITAAGTRIPIQRTLENAVIDLRSLTTDGQPEDTGSGLTYYTEVNRPGFQTVADSTTTPINFDTVVENNDGVFSVGTPTRFTIPAGAGGVWQGAFWANWNTNSTGFRENGVRKNGSALYYVDDRIGLTGNSTSLLIPWTLRLSAGDYIEYFGWQNSGGDLGLRAQSAYIARAGD